MVGGGRRSEKRKTRRNNMIKIAFFDTKEYDKKLFEEYNLKYNYDITYFESNLIMKQHL